MLNKAKLKFPRTLVLKSNLLLPISFSPVEYQIDNLLIKSGKIDFTLGDKHFRNVDVAKLGIDIVKE